MINDPVKHVRNYIDAGSDIITVHAEVCDESSFGEICDQLHSNQVGIGLAINPDTDLPQWSYKFVEMLDQIIVMSVVPGKSGQKFIESTHEKIQRITKDLYDHKFEGYIEVDGGVNLENIGACFADGGRAFVGGSAIIGQSDVRMIIKEFRNQVLYSRRRLLIKKAHDLGGVDLVNKWIDLHVVGKKKDGLVQIAKELGFQ
jgi:transketolase